MNVPATSRVLAELAAGRRLASAEGTGQEYLFAKLCTKGHVRADRWYKIW
jgi:hypothetical protein